MIHHGARAPKPPRGSRKVGMAEIAVRVLRRTKDHPANSDAPARAMLRALAWQVRKRLWYGPVRITAYDLDLEFPRTSGSLSNYFYFGECFEWEVICFIRAYLRPGERVLDVGANVGMFTYAAYQCVKPTGHVTALEPSPWAAATIRRNVSINGLSDSIEVLEVAAASTEGEAEFTADLDVSNHLKRSSGRTFSRDSIVVQVRSLDSLVEDDTLISLMKLDVEGAEMLALNGFRRHLSEGNPPVILMEAHDHSLRKMGSSREAVMSLMGEVGYGQYVYDHSGLKRPPPGWNDDVVLIHSASSSDVMRRLDS